MPRMPSLSVAVFAHTPPARIAAQLAPLRAVVDEIVVAIDDTAADTDLTPLEGIADIAIVAPFEWPLESNLEWLQRQCSGDWVLRLDGDEFASRALLDLLTGNEWYRGVTHSYVPRRWLVDGGRSWIRSNPWWPDPQLRFVKNDPGLVTVQRRAHGRIDVSGPHKVLPAPIYHTDIIDSDLGVRQAKAHRYLEMSPDLRAPSGHDMTIYYTPELEMPAPIVLPVPADDLPFLDVAVTNVVRPRRSPTPLVGANHEPATSEAMTVKLIDPECAGYAGARVEFLATITNTGIEPLDPGSEHPARLGARWFGDGPDVLGEARADIPYPLESGDSVTVLFASEIPEDLDTYTLVIGGVAEGSHWFKPSLTHRFDAMTSP